MPKHGTNIRKRADGRWEGRYKIPQSNNSCKYKSVYGKTCREVKEKLEYITIQQQKCVLKDEMETIKNIEAPGDFTLISVKWLATINETRKYSTYIKYRGIYERHIRDTIGSTSVYDISYNLVNEKIFQRDDKIQYSQNLRHSIIAVINQILKYAAENYEYPEIQLINKVINHKRKKIEIINHTEQASLVRYLYHDMDASKAGILLCIFTGLRLGEICSLKWDDIDFDQMIIHVRRTVQRVAIEDSRCRTTLIITEPKSTFSIREIPMSTATVQVLNRIKHDEEYVVGGKAPLDPRTYQNRFKRYLKETSIKEYNFHALRHTFATNCIDHDMDVKSLSEILGHANIQITLNKYVHPTMDTKRRQLAVLDSVYSHMHHYYFLSGGDGKSYACPIDAQHILVIGKKGVEKKVELKEAAEGDEMFSFPRRYGKYILLPPVDYPAVVRYDTVTGEIRYFTENTDGYVKEKNNQKITGGSLVYQGNLYIASPVDNMLYKLDIESGRSSMIELPVRSRCGGNVVVEYDNEIWITPYDGQVIVRWNPDTNEVREYGVLPVK